MRSDELQRRIGPPSALSHIIVIEQRDLADSFQALLPFLHPGMGRRRASSGRKEKTRFHRWKLGFLPDSANRLPAASRLFCKLVSAGKSARRPRQAGSLSSIGQRSLKSIKKWGLGFFQLPPRLIQ